MIGLSPIWFVCNCVGPMWQFKHVLRYFHMCLCIVHSCCSLLHAMCLTECPYDILVLFWTQLSSIAWVCPWLNMLDMFWSLGGCFDHFSQFVPYHAMQLLGTHYASPATRSCISSCTHMHSQLFSCIVFMFTWFSYYSMVFWFCYALF